jgi:signal peptidase I
MLRYEQRPPALVPVDENTPCGEAQYHDAQGHSLEISAADGKQYCRLPVMREMLPSGRYYDTLDLEDASLYDNYGPTRVPPGRVFLMGDNRDRSADSRVSLDADGLGGPVPWENLGGRAEFITFSLDGTSKIWNPITWLTALRSGRAGTSLHPATMK